MKKAYYVMIGKQWLSYQGKKVTDVSEAKIFTADQKRFRQKLVALYGHSDNEIQFIDVVSVNRDIKLKDILK